MRTNPWIGATAVLKAALTFAAVYAIALGFNMPLLTSLQLAPLAMSTSPATPMRVINEQCSSGQVTERVLDLTAVNRLFSVFTFKVIVGFWTFQSSGIRPQRELGTIELRVCDTPLTVERAAALAGYLQALCRWLLERSEPLPAEDNYPVYNYNRFQACRFGLDGTVVYQKTYKSVSMLDDILVRLLSERMAPTDAPALKHLGRVANFGSYATYLRQQYLERGSSEGRSTPQLPASGSEARRDHRTSGRTARRATQRECRISPSAVRSAGTWRAARHRPSPP